MLNKHIGYFNFFNDTWFKNKQNILLWFLNNKILKYWARWILRIHKDISSNEIISFLSPSSFRVILGDNKYKQDFRTHNKFSKRIYFAFKPIWWLMHIWDYLISFGNRIPILQFGLDTFTQYTNSGYSNQFVRDVDSTVYDNPSMYFTWSDMRVGGSFKSNSYADIPNESDYFGMILGAKFYTLGTLYRMAGSSSYIFDMNSFSYPCTIYSGVFSCCVGKTGIYNYQVYSGIISDSLYPAGFDILIGACTSEWPFTPSQATMVTPGMDYISTRKHSSELPLGNTNQRFNFHLTNSGIYNLEQWVGKYHTYWDGYYTIAGHLSNVYDNVEPTPLWSGLLQGDYYMLGYDCRHADYTGISSDPKLVVYYSPTCVTII